MPLDLYYDEIMHYGGHTSIHIQYIRVYIYIYIYVCVRKSYIYIIIYEYIYLCLDIAKKNVVI